MNDLDIERIQNDLIGLCILNDYIISSVNIYEKEDKKLISWCVINNKTHNQFILNSLVDAKYWHARYIWLFAHINKKYDLRIYTSELSAINEENICGIFYNIKTGEIKNFNC